MLHRRSLRLPSLLLAFVSCVLWLAPPLSAAPRSTPLFHQADPSSLQRMFAEAAREFGVPEHVLLAVAYNESRWENHASSPSAAGGYGLMHLVSGAYRAQLDGKGDGIDRLAYASASGGAGPLELAAGLIGLSPDLLKKDPQANIRGGAALLARYAHDTTGRNPIAEGDWYGAVAKYSGSSDGVVAFDFADVVYAIMRQGAARTTSDGQMVALAVQDVVPNRASARSLLLRRPPATVADCPSSLPCLFVPAAYQLNAPPDRTDYGNYDFANRPADDLPVRYIVIHNTEANFNSTLNIFQNPSSYVSIHYVVRSADGQVVQMTRDKNVAWHAGNWFFNGQAIGIEHEGVAIEGATWYSEQMYRASASIVRYLAHKYNIPLDRAHIIGHDEIPGPAPANQAGMHWDPGPFWDWAHYMQLLGAPLGTTPDDGKSPLVTITPPFAGNQPLLTYCYTQEKTDCRGVPTQNANFVYLHTAPDANAPLITNPYIKSDPTLANNWANKAVTGQQFYRLDRKGDWDAIFYGGQIAWFYNPGRAYTAPAHGLLVTPKAGLASIPVYGRAYPEEAAYPTGVVTQTLTPIYDMPAGQIYVAYDRLAGSFYSAPTFAPSLESSDHTVITGKLEYYQISFNHRIAFVKASDVELVSNRPTRGDAVSR